MAAVIPCPLCHKPLKPSDGRPPRITRLGARQYWICECGVEAWVGKSAADGQPFVASFVPNRVLTVRRVTDGET